MQELLAGSKLLVTVTTKSNFIRLPNAVIGVAQFESSYFIDINFFEKTKKIRRKPPESQTRLFYWACDQIAGKGYDVNADRFLELFNDLDGSGILDRIESLIDPLKIIVERVLPGKHVALAIGRSVKLEDGEFRGKQRTWDKDFIRDKIGKWRKYCDAEG